MSDTYQAVYDAVSRKVGGFQDAVRSALDISFAVEQVKSTIQEVVYEHMRPSVLFRPTLVQADGQWRAQYGDLVATGDSPQAAAWAFDAAWTEKATTPTAEVTP